MAKRPKGERRQLRGRIATVARLSDVTVTTFDAELGHEWVCIIRGVREEDRPAPSSGRRSRRSQGKGAQ